MNKYFFYNYLKRTLSSLFLLGITSISFSQGTDCNSADPFCSGTTYNFPNNTGVSATSGPNYGCVSNAKNPAWYYMKIAESGPMKLNIKQTTQQNGAGSGLDVDFAMWGPFTDESVGCAGIMNGSTPPIQSSYSTAAVETIGLGMQGGSNSICPAGVSGATIPPAAVQGEYYMVLVTNYSNSSGYITLNQTNDSSAGAGVTDCSIVNCDIAKIVATPVCNGDSITVTGAVTVATNITTGTLNVSSTCGQTILFYPPFPTTATDLSFTFNAGLADGQPCEISATFSDNLGCEKKVTINKQQTPAAPIFFAVGGTCSGSGSTKITNYDPTFTYTFTPAGPTINTDGEVIGAVEGTSYSVTTSNDGCLSEAVSFTNAPQSPPPAGPLAESPQSFCDSAQVSDLLVTGTNIRWYSSVTSTTQMDPSDSVITGTYYATQTINGCESEKTPVEVIINTHPIIDAGADKTICLGQSTSLKVTGAETYTWSPVTGLNNATGQSVIANPNTTTTYIVKGTDVNGCVGYDSVTVMLSESPDAGFSYTPSSGTPPLEVEFTNTSENANSYLWDFGNGGKANSIDASSAYINPGDYTVILTASNGLCNDTAMAIITVMPFPEPTIVIPNVFTPNGDDANDEFFVTTTLIKEMHMEIFNRWGNSMGTLNSPIDKWDGDGASAGVYFYKYTMTDFNGLSYEGHGFFHLVRK